MPSFERDSHRIVIAGASSLLGAELKSLLEESKFAGWDLRLVDEEVAAGTLTEAGGEPAVIQPVEERSFDRARLIFFTGSPEFARANLKLAAATGARVIDLSGAALEDSHGTPADDTPAVAWFPKLDALRGEEFALEENLFGVPSAAATATAALALALSKLGLLWMNAVHFHPVSEVGRAGIEELEAQTGKLLSFQPFGQPVFDTQVAFNMLDRFGAGSRQKLQSAVQRIRAEVRASVNNKVALPAVQVLHAPVFYGATFSACAAVDVGGGQPIAEACRVGDFVIVPEGQAGPSNVSVAGERAIFLAHPETDPSEFGKFWIWGAADNIRLPAWNAVKLAEKLV
jgi:aspartate-semialdehyde dehydrogenase